MNPFSILRRYFINIEKSAGQLAEIREGIANLTSLLNDKLDQMIEITQSQSTGQLAEIKEVIPSPASILHDKPDCVTGHGEIELHFASVQGLDFSSINISTPNPIPAIMASQTYQSLIKVFTDSPSITRTLVPPHAQALLYSLICLQRSKTVVEIGTYLASTTEAMARAVFSNQCGVLHTVDPFAAQFSAPIIAKWPQHLKEVTQAHQCGSMYFFADMKRKQQMADLIFIDGHHDYEFALFDIQCAAKIMNPGGFIVIDNVSQIGPFFAAVDFMKRARSHGWEECGDCLGRYAPGDAYFSNRSPIPYTDFIILRAPQFYSIGSRTMTFGDIPWYNGNTALRLLPVLDAAASGFLKAQFIIRVFDDPISEIVVNLDDILIDKNEIIVNISFPHTKDSVYKSIEPWFSWNGTNVLYLKELPSVF